MIHEYPQTIYRKLSSHPEPTPHPSSGQTQKRTKNKNSNQYRPDNYTICSNKKSAGLLQNNVM